MMEFPQPGQPHNALQADLQPSLSSHPDADQLSAFAEQVLPAHEREDLLLHLAACARCREVVSLAMPAFEAHTPERAAAHAQQVRPTQPAKWFADWRLWLPSGAIAAALLVLGIHLHNERPVGAPQPVQTASISAPTGVTLEPNALSDLPPRERAGAPPLATGTLAPAPAKATATPKVQTPAADVARTAAAPPTVSMAPTASAGMAGRASDQSFANASSLSPDYRLRTAPAVPQGSTASQGQSYRGTGQGAIGGVQQATVSPSPQQLPQQQMLQAAPMPAPAPQQQIADQQAASVLGQTGVVNGRNIDPNMAPNRVAAASPSVAFAKLRSASNAPLPSHLATASSATDASRTLAVDTAGTLFLSVDAGLHWMPVHTPWKDRVATLTRAGFAVGAHRGAATIGGLITDPSGAVIPGASITVADARGEAATAHSNSSGRYFAEHLAPGTYTVTANAPGFEQRQGSVTLSATAQAVFDMRLNVGSMNETVNVTAADSIMDEVQATPATKARKKKAEPPAPPLFEVTTSRGERWTSADGLAWTQAGAPQK